VGTPLDQQPSAVITEDPEQRRRFYRRLFDRLDAGKRTRASVVKRRSAFETNALSLLVAGWAGKHLPALSPDSVSARSVSVFVV
jgi:hypothetical protein